MPIAMSSPPNRRLQAGAQGGHVIRSFASCLSLVGGNADQRPVASMA
ncbi:MAG: hypothetical protein QM750_17325 [Rubrivivax sp.]